MKLGKEWCYQMTLQMLKCNSSFSANTQTNVLLRFGLGATRLHAQLLYNTGRHKEVVEFVQACQEKAGEDNALADPNLQAMASCLQ